MLIKLGDRLNDSCVDWSNLEFVTGKMNIMTRFNFWAGIIK